MADQSTYLKAFNTLMNDFLDDLDNIFPNDKLMKQCTTSMRTVRKANPKITIRVWNKYLLTPYEKYISPDNMDYFFNKDYKNDLTRLPNSEYVAESIEMLRGSVKNMGDENKKQTGLYMIKLNKLCDAYWGGMRILKNNQQVTKEELEHIDQSKVIVPPNA